MVDAFKEAAEKAKAAGLISEYYHREWRRNGESAEFANEQSDSQGVDAIAINAASPTALNGVIEKACQAGHQSRRF